jgi:hypothetical protein
MKYILLYSILISFSCLKTIQAQEKESRKVFKEEIAFENLDKENMVLVRNINGFIDVQGYDGDKIILEVEKIIRADSEVYLDLGNKEVTYVAYPNGKSISIGLDGPCLIWGENKKFIYEDCSFGNNSKYYFILNYKLKVPKGTSLDLATVNNGKILVENTRGEILKVDNVNGEIIMKNVTGQTDVHSINGKVDIAYASVPKVSSKYYSLTGDIHVTYPRELSADISFKTMKGNIYTDFIFEKKYSKKIVDKNINDANFKLEQVPVLVIGDGGISLEFETQDGDITLKKGN